MPEGHILHRLARGLDELRGPPLRVSSPQGRFPGAGLLDGSRLSTAEAYGKHLLLHFRPGAVHVHLGMQGKFLRLAPPPPPRPQVRLRLATAAVAWDLIAPARCELLDDGRVAALLAGLGPDPLRADAGPLPESEARHVYRQSRCRRCATPVDVTSIGRRTAYACPRCQV